MSRRNRVKNDPDPLLLPGVGKVEWKLKNYLHVNQIYRDNNDMQTIIINSFYNQCGLNNDDGWKAKLKFADENFGKFAQYAQNNWKPNISKN